MTRVAAAELHHEDGRRFVWLVSHAGEEVTVAPSLAGSLVDLDGGPVEKVTLEPYGVTVLERHP